MAMNKKEQKELEDAKIAAALRWTAPVAPDVNPPSPMHPGERLSKGFLFNAHSREVRPSCSSSISHSYGRDDKTTSQGARALYSTRLLALKALRHECEKQFAEILRIIDKRIEGEQQ